MVVLTKNGWWNKFGEEEIEEIKKYEFNAESS
jgi:hypothetical protein